jgi:dTDP-4-dehydrorhamnose 3,5-epimerase
LNIQETKLDGIYIITPEIFQDHRGFFMESYNKEKFSKYDLHYGFVQDNHSLSLEAGVLRGLHFQLSPKAQTKIS